MSAVLIAPLAGFALPSEWRNEQHFEISSPGLVKIGLPPETLDAARPGLEDLRLCDASGSDLPFFIVRQAPAGRAIRHARTFQVSLNAAATVITLETGQAQPVDGVTLNTTALDFIKSVSVEGSADGGSWQMLAQGRPIFRQPYGAEQLVVSFPAGAWRWLRLTVDDQRSRPVPFTGAGVHAAAVREIPGEWQAADIIERNENPGETRMVINLGAANLDVATVQIVTDEPLFTREITATMAEIAGDAIRESVVGRGAIYRVAVGEQAPPASLNVPIEARIRSRELILLIRNEDSPPLPVKEVRFERRPVHVVFLASRAGTFHLLTGNKSCPAPRYDLASLGADLKNAAVAPVIVSGLAANPDYRAPEALAGLAASGPVLDVSAWKFRKALKLDRGGVQQVELDPEVLAQTRGADLRIVRGSNQVPYIVQRTSISRVLTPTITVTNDAKNPKTSRWIITLPKTGLPITRLTCGTRTPLFHRALLLSEEVTDERGGKYRRPLGSATWTQTPERKTREMSLPLDSEVRSDTLILETENGDNPPVELEQFRAHYPVARLLFKAQADDRLFLYYGNPRALPPTYDLTLIAGEMLAADKATATAGAEEQLKKSSWAESGALGTGGFVFWGILAVVVVGLLVIISRLLPKASSAG